MFFFIIIDRCENVLLKSIVFVVVWCIVVDENTCTSSCIVVNACDNMFKYILL